MSKASIGIFITFSLILIVGAVPGLSDEWSFLGATDTREGNALEISLKWATENLVGPPPQFLIHCGDLDPASETEEVIKKYFGKPFYPSMGNHEKNASRNHTYQSLYLGKKLPNLVDSTFIEAKGVEALFYSFAYRNLYFIILDVFYLDPFRQFGNVYGEQLKWLEDQLVNNPYPYVFVMGHEPAFPQPWQRNYGDCLDRYPQDRDRFWSVLSTYKVSGYFCGHTHSYLRQRIQDVWHLDLGECAEIENIDTFSNFHVTDDSISVTTYRITGGIREQFSIKPRLVANPVELSSFSYDLIDAQVQLAWQTTTETNNYGFEIQKSLDRVNYDRIGFVAGHGTTQESQRYEFLDQASNSGISYYRLKQIDHDGEFDFSKTIEADIQTTPVFWLSQNYPNPFNQETTLCYEIDEPGYVNLNIYNLNGQVVYCLVDEYRDSGAYLVNWSGADRSGNDLPSGIYFYQLMTANKRVTMKMLLTR